MSNYGGVWNIAYKTYPKLLRILESVGVHSGRQPFLLGRLHPRYTSDNLKAHLKANGFETAVLAWKDTDEVLSMRKVNEHAFQWHIRLYTDGEIRGHYEYSSEGNPLGHVLGKLFKPEKEFFGALLGDFLEI